MTIYLDVTKLVSVVSEVTYMGFHIPVDASLVNTSFRVEIECDGAKFRLIQQSA